MDVKYRRLDAEYDALPITGDARQKYLEQRPDYKTARFKRGGYELLGTADENAIDQWVEYNQLPEYGFWRERYRMENPDFDKGVLMAQKGKNLSQWVVIDPKKIPNKKYDEIYGQFKDLFDEYDDVTGTDAERESKRKTIFMQNPAFQTAYYRRKAYGIFFDEKYVENYVEYSLMPKKGYADLRYLKAHPEFYRELKKKAGWTSPDPKWDLIPSEKIESLYNYYEGLTPGKRREDFRREHPDLDDWLFATGKVTKTIAETKRRAELTPYEKFEEDLGNIRKKTQKYEQFEKSIEPALGKAK